MSTIPNSISSSLNQLKLSNLSQIKLSNTCKTTILSHQIIAFVVNEIKVIPGYEAMSNDLHLMHHIANVIENLERNDLNPKLDKKQLYLDIIKQLFPTLTTLTTEQLLFVDNFADFIVANKLVNKLSTITKFTNSVKKKFASYVIIDLNQQLNPSLIQTQYQWSTPLETPKILKKIPRSSKL